MKKIFLFCEAGMSTSFMVSKMQEVANKHNLDIHIEAFPAGKSHVLINEKRPDCVLLGPQVRFLFNKIEEDCIPLNIPIAPIEPASYGAMDGEKVLKQAIRLIKGNSK